MDKKELYDSIKQWMNNPSNFPSNQDKYMLGNATSYYQQLCKIMKYLQILTEEGAGGGVKSITAGNGLLGGTITESGTIEIDEEVVETVAHAIQTFATISALAEKQDILTAGENITIENNVISAKGDISVDYEDLTNKPSINGYTIEGTMTGEDLGLVNSEDLENYIVKEDAPGYDDILTQTSAASTYETIANATTLANRVTAVEGDITEIDQDIISLENGKQDTLVSGTNIKTVNSKSIVGNGNAELNASDIYASNQETVQSNLERIDGRVDGKQDTLTTAQLNAVNSGITSSIVGRTLLAPISAPQNDEIVGIGDDNSQIRIQLGDMTLSGSTSPFTLKTNLTYTTLTIATSEWSSDTLDGETCVSATKLLTGALFGKHPIVSCLPSSIATMDNENEAFNLIVKLIENNGNIKFYAKETPTTNITIQVVNY